MIKYGIITIFCLGIYSSVAFASQQKNAATCSPEKAVYKPHPKYKLLENEGIDLTLTISREGVTNPDVYGHYADFVIDVYDVKKQHLRAKIKLRWSCSGVLTQRAPQELVMDEIWQWLGWIKTMGRTP